MANANSKLTVRLRWIEKRVLGLPLATFLNRRETTRFSRACQASTRNLARCVVPFICVVSFRWCRLCSTGPLQGQRCEILVLLLRRPVQTSKDNCRPRRRSLYFSNDVDLCHSLRAGHRRPGCGESCHGGRRASGDQHVWWFRTLRRRRRH